MKKITILILIIISLGFIPIKNNNTLFYSFRKNYNSPDGSSSIQSITFNGNNCTSIDGTHYSITVANTVSKGIIKVATDDKTSTIKGDGEISLKVGNNSFNVIVTSNNGSITNYVVDITRKDAYSINDLSSALKEEKVVIHLQKGDIITKGQLESIKSSKKIVEFVKYSGEDEVYRWIIDGNLLDNISDLDSTVSVKVDSNKGIYIELDSISDIPKGVNLSINLSSYSKNNYDFYSYTGKNKEMKLIEKKVKIDNEFFTFTPTSGNYYLKVSSNMIELPSFMQNEIILSVIISVFVFLLLLFIIFIIKKISKKRRSV